MSLRTKFFSGFALFILIAVILSGFFYSCLSKIQAFGAIITDMHSITSQSDTLVENIKEINEIIVLTKSLTVIFAVIAIVFGITACLLLIRNVAFPVRLVADGVSKAAAGDLTGREVVIELKDELGQLAGTFNGMLAKLKEIIFELQEKSVSVTASANQLSASAENVAAGASETALTANQLAETTEQVTENIQKAADTSAQAAVYAQEGRQSIDKFNSRMEGIIKATSTSGEAIIELSHLSAKISNIVEIITSIAEQTNLLALNAAIEAARAGEQGKGFAVVAEEVRKLAEESAVAAKEINNLVVNIQQGANKAVQTMEEGNAQIQTGSGAIMEMGETFEKIIAAAQNVADEVCSVAAAVEEVATATQSLSASTEEQTAAIEEISSTTQVLVIIAQDMENLAGYFKTSRV